MADSMPPLIWKKPSEVRPPAGGQQATQQQQQQQQQQGTVRWCDAGKVFEPGKNYRKQTTVQAMHNQAGN
jgi:hypothetical protein